MNNKIDNLLLLFLLCLGLVSGHYSYTIIKDAYRDYSAENKCIAEYVSKGVERRDIVRTKGTCKVIKH